MASKIAKTKTGIGSKATKIWNDNGHFMVQLYATVVYDETAETVTLQNGGWNTPTTAQRINSALQYRGFNTGISTAGGTMKYEGKPFVDGVLVLNVSDLRKEKIKLDKEIEEDIAKWRKELDCQTKKVA